MHHNVAFFRLEPMLTVRYWGEGRHGGIFSSYLVAAPVRESRAGSSDCGDPSTWRWRIVGKVGGGFKDEERHELNSRLEQHWIAIDRSAVVNASIKTRDDLMDALGPRQRFFASISSFEKGHFPWPKFWIDPLKSVVLEVTVSEVHPYVVPIMHIYGEERGESCVYSYT